MKIQIVQTLTLHNSIQKAEMIMKKTILKINSRISISIQEVSLHSTKINNRSIHMEDVLVAQVLGILNTREHKQQRLFKMTMIEMMM